MGEYAASGVDEHREQTAFATAMRPHLAATRAHHPGVDVVAGIGSGHFASVLSLPAGARVAVTTDGVGTKILLARTLGRYDTVGVDVVANNVNDLVCLGADPVALVDYVALDEPDEELLGELARGMAAGAEAAGIAIVGGEIAQVGAMLAPRDPTTATEPMFDLVGTAIGVVPPGRDLMDGRAVVPGDAIVGVASSGLHSNGYSLARRALADTPLDRPLGDGRTLGEALLAPTRIYVGAARALWEAGVAVHGIVHMSGGGLLNLARLAAEGVAYRLGSLPAPPEVFTLVEAAGGIGEAEMHATFNMGVGLAVVVPPGEVSRTVAIVEGAGERAVVIGDVVDGDGAVTIPGRRLVGRGDGFTEG